MSPSSCPSARAHADGTPGRSSPPHSHLIFIVRLASLESRAAGDGPRRNTSVPWFEHRETIRQARTLGFHESANCIAQRRANQDHTRAFHPFDESEPTEVLVLRESTRCSNDARSMTSRSTVRSPSSASARTSCPAARSARTAAKSQLSSARKRKAGDQPAVLERTIASWAIESAAYARLA